MTTGRIVTAARRRVGPSLLAVLIVCAAGGAASSQDKPPSPAKAPAPAPRTTSRRPYATGAVHLSIERGLCWLSRHQDEKGCWSGATCAKACAAIEPRVPPCQPETALDGGGYSTQGDVGCTALALLAFLRAGQCDDSATIIEDPLNKHRLTVGPDIVHKGLAWLVSRQQPDGSFTEPGNFLLYNEAIATLALCEAYGLTGHEEWKAPAQKAVDFICKAQKPHPTEPSRRWGWRYYPSGVEGQAAGHTEGPSEGDMSVTGWMVMALKTAKAAGLEVPQATLDGALAFTRWSTAEHGLVGYLGPDTAGLPISGENDNYVYHFGTMSSIGMEVRMVLEHDAEDPFLFEAADRLMRELPTEGVDESHPQVDYYYWYYGTLALNQLDGPDGLRRPSKYATIWNKAMSDTLIGMQGRIKGVCGFGGWTTPDRWSYGFGPVYTTAMSLLCLEACYRY